MTYPLILDQGLIAVAGEIMGPSGTVSLQLGLDTGASSSLISLKRLAEAGYDPSQALRTASITTAGGQVSAPVIIAYRLSALGANRVPIAVLGYDIPGKIGIDGLLGLDFFQA